MDPTESNTARADIQRRLLELCPTAAAILERALRTAPKDSRASVDLAVTILQLAGFDGAPRVLAADGEPPTATRTESEPTAT